MFMLYLPVSGTFARRRGMALTPDDLDWFYKNSRFDRFLRINGYFRVDQDRDPNRPDKGFWRGDLGGTTIQRLWPWADHLSAWQAPGDAVVDFLLKRADDFIPEGLLVVTHSHGGHLLIEGLYTRKYPLPFKLYVVDIDMPVQRPSSYDHDKYLHASRIAHWTHVYSGKRLRDLWKTRYRWLGNRAGPLKMPYVYNHGPVNGGHSGVLSGSDNDMNQISELVSDIGVRSRHESTFT